MNDIARTRAATAKAALEQVCSGARVSSADDFYSTDFVDHVNGSDYHGHEGIRRSVQGYTKILSDIRIVVKDQLSDADRVTSRFTVTGRCYGRQVSFEGITISRFDGAKIIEDWSISDVLGMLKRLGVWRCLLLALRH
jgi:predicted ester cyclase